MDTIRLGRTGLSVSRSGFGAIPIQRIGADEAKYLLRKAYDNGINFFDTARRYRDSEEKIGNALAHVRKNIVLATKTLAVDGKTLFAELEESLKKLKTDYIDIYQLHDPKKFPDISSPEGAYEAMLKAREKGMIRFLGLTSHKLDFAIRGATSGFFDTVQFPLSSLSSAEDLSLADVCRKEDVGLIAMKALAGGLITNAGSTFAFLHQFGNIAPIWGIQRESELDEFIFLEKNPPPLDEKLKRIIEQDRKELSGMFCRGCGYCLPCPADIPIPTAARMYAFLRKALYQRYLTDEWKEKMGRIEQCTECGQCKDQCPYELDTPNLLKHMLKDYRDFCETHTMT
ncbi:MAG: aldo/keto reductase [Deltaproteobacteria bacterium]|nr:aldo/keto reductase [Deltaproteobacteria bacterium]